VSEITVTFLEDLSCKQFVLKTDGQHTQVCDTIVIMIKNKNETENCRKLEANTHKSTMTHTGNVFVPRDLDLLIPK